MFLFRDRGDAGRRLASALREEVGPNVVVLGLARGGVPVAYEVARRLRAPLDVLVVRKLGVPGHEELAMGAIGPGGSLVLNDEVIRRLRIPQTAVEAAAARERAEAERRERTYRRGQPPEDVRGRHAIVVDDGLATGASMRAAIASLRTLGAARITVAVPTGSAESCDELRRDADEVLCLTASESLFAVGQSYDDFSPTTDDEVRDYLARATRQRLAARPSAPR
ncbi:MAG TPA: phosphoribosyltransferase family protein [Polyangiaceae bacterium]|nr:phosphoribosyltransferase family protein [Polyangiaceae bacterium]